MAQLAVTKAIALLGGAAKAAGTAGAGAAAAKALGPKLPDIDPVQPLAPVATEEAAQPAVDSLLAQRKRRRTIASTVAGGTARRNTLG